MQCPKAAIFDLDETLAVSFNPPTEPMLARITALQKVLPVVIMSGAGFDRIQRDVIAHLPESPTNLVLFPNSSSQCFMLKNGTWETVYNHVLNESERATIKSVLQSALTQHDDLKDVVAYGPQIVDREAQIAFTGVGQDAPTEVKAAWDPTAEKRLRIARTLKEQLPEFDILIGGASTIDVTRKDTNKSYGVRWYADYLHVQPSDMLYVGDALYPGGNDEVVILTGVQTRAVANPTETETIIDEILAACSI
jgi:HAD superfamily hydrolase (TIGR01484 family)